MSTQKTHPATLSSMQLAVLWFGAAVSLAEIMTGALYDSLGVGLAALAIISGHLVGAVAFFAVGWISWREDKDAIAVADSSLGRPGVLGFAFVNALQLIGWTAVMILAGAEGLRAAAAAAGIELPMIHARLITGGLLLVWTVSGNRGMRGLNVGAVVLLFVLSVVWAARLAFLPSAHPAGSVANTVDFSSFGNLMELAVIMPLSWLPLVGDYTRNAGHGRRGVFAASAGYFLGSCAMYFVGLLSVSKLPDAGPVASMIKTGLGLGAALVVLLSTVTTGFLDVRSAGVSIRLVFPRMGERAAPLLMGVLGLVLAMAVPGGWYDNFLYALGSVFAPFFGVIFCRRLFFSRNTPSIPSIVPGFLAWGTGLGAYYLLLSGGTPLGVSVPSLLVAMATYFLLMKGVSLWKLKN